ncbi:MAG TPA: alpha/beta hydrolase-fold protein [Pyrinomonadaceae bacterium]|nr:alpha/beta hydrolase-fold protein [Pyrinomonadaceae bacterium]
MHQRPPSLATLFLMLIHISLFYSVARAQDGHTLTGEFRTHKNFHSRFLTSDRDVLVYLPPGYDADKRKRYPVLYLHDGQNLFDGATSFIKGAEWGVDETAQRLITEGAIEPLIIVGVYNTGKDRVEEYTPTADARHKVGGKADLYGRMLVEELKPFIDSEYRTRRDAKHTGLGGSSLGGLVSLYLALKHPQTFGRVVVASPSVWWDNKMILREVEALKKRPRLHIWLDMGTKEGGNEAEEHTRNARALRDALARKGWKEGSDLKYFEAEGAEHNERAWAARVEPMLRFLFPKK